MKIAIFDAKEYDIKSFNEANKGRHELIFFKENLKPRTANLAKGFDAVCGFVNTLGNEEVLESISKLGIKYWFQRSMGYNGLNLQKMNDFGIKAYRVFNYSAETVAEHAASLMMTLNRNLVEANKRTSKFNFSLDGLEGKCINSSTVGVIGSGKIGQSFIKIMKGMGANVIVYDEYAQTNFPQTAGNLGFEYVSLNKLLKNSDFISIHAPLLPSTHHIINDDAISKMKNGVVIINASRGSLIDTSALIKGIKSNKIRAAGLDVIEREKNRFFFDRSQDSQSITERDPEWGFLANSDKVIITSHQAFFSDLALSQIAELTLKHADEAEKGDFSKSLQLLGDGKVLNG